METVLGFILIFGAISGFSKGTGILPDDPLHRASGDSVMFSLKTPPETPFDAVTWTFNGRTIGNSSPAGENIEANYTGRARIFLSNGSLELSSLTTADSGEYEVLVFPGPESGNITLRVYAPISNVTIDPETLNLVELNDSLRLSCNSSGSPVAFVWYKDSEIAGSGRLLSLEMVFRSDQGNYTCEAINPFSSATSDPAIVTIYYGPENVKIAPPGNEHLVGSNITMMCSADSSPPAQFTWFLNGHQLPDTGPELKLMNVNLNQSGSYSCQAFNTETLRYQTSEPSRIKVVGGSSGCGAGCIAGIVIACIVLVAALVAGGYFIYQKK